VRHVSERQVSERRGQSGWRIGALAALAVLAGAQLGPQLLSRLWFTTQDPARTREPAQVTPVRAALAPARVDAPPDSGADVQAEGRLEAAADGRLVPNTALLQVLNHFLLARSDAGADAALSRYLDARLPPRAVGDALRVATAYRAYMGVHDALLAAQNLPSQAAGVTAAALARLSTWRDQRARLRQRMFDPALVQAWYGDEDLELIQTIDELRRADEVPGATGDASARPLPHWRDPAGAARHGRYLLDIIGRAVTPFSALRRSSAS
jgi:hypothetical protein